MEFNGRSTIQNILNASRIGLWRVEFEEGKAPRFYADELMNELIGTPPDMTPEERYRFHIARIHPDDRKLFEEYADKLTEVRTEIVYRYIHPASGEMLVRCNGGRDPSYPYICTMGTHQDISDTVRLENNKQVERHLAERNLSLRREQLEQESYYRALLDLQNCGLLAYTLPGHKIIHMNAEALRMYGVHSIGEAQTYLGVLLSKIYYPDEKTLPRLKSLRTEDDMAVDYESVLNYGEPNECHIMAKTKVVRMPSGQRAVITTFLDVSDMILLRRALKQAEEGSRAKTSFLFAMSHDLRTPMNAIIGYADLIESHRGQEELCREYMRKLKGASRFLLSLIGNVLELSRIESGKETLYETPFDLNQLNDTLDMLLDSELANKKLSVHRVMEIETPYVWCDAMKLREIVMNLLSNAIKYTPEGGSITLTVTAQAVIAQGDAHPTASVVTIKVEDTGIGISEEYIPYLFDAFSREKSSSESGIMGTGLGLRIVKSFVDLMNGEITVQSQPGKGSCFTVVLPLGLADKPRETEQTEAEQDRLPVSGKRVLLAEDNALNVEITTTVLEDAGVCVETAGDGAAALEMLRRMPAGYYDLILMDIQMPRMNGYQAAEAIRDLPDRRADTPIIAMTANAFEEDRKAAFDAGMDDYITKPIELQKLLHAVGTARRKNRKPYRVK